MTTYPVNHIAIAASDPNAASLGKIEANGGKTIMPKTENPGIGHFAVFAHTGAFGGHTIMVGKGSVYNAAVGGGHRLQGYRPVGLNHPGGHFGGHVPQGILPPLAISFHVQGHPHSLPKLVADNQVD